MQDVLTQKDIAGKDHWNATWADNALPPPIDPDSKAASNYVVRRFHDLFKDLFSRIDTNAKKLLEIGCARSVWLPYFAKYYGFNVSGIDYSNAGCQQARATLERDSIAGEIVCCDFHSRPDLFVGQFDVVVSLGVVEHYADTQECIACFSDYLKPGGRLITVIPNMTGAMGLMQRYLDISVYKMHVPLSASQLKYAHEKNGLEVEYCKYFMFTNFGVLNTSRLKKSGLISQIKPKIAVNLSRVSRLIGSIEDRTLRLPALPFLAPYVVCVCRKVMKTRNQ